MILVGGEPVFVDNSSEGKENLLGKLLDHPLLVASANSLKETGLQTVKPPHPSGNEENTLSTDTGDAELVNSHENSKFVYIFQKEYATASPLFAEMIGTDEITTCIGLVLRDPLSGLTSVGHFDTAECVVTGVNQLVASVASISCSTMQVHIVGAYDDSSDFTEQIPSVVSTPDSEGLVKDNAGGRPGWSWPLAVKMIETLQNSAHNFELETCCILEHNTSIGPSGHTCPTVRGFMVETSSGVLTPARFESEARGPDATVRGLCTITISSDSNWIPSLISPYETQSDNFTISPFQWSNIFRRYAAYMLTLSDEEFLETFSTSPYAEGPDFLPTSRRIFKYLEKCPYWEQSFPNNEPRVFTRTSTGGWTQKPHSR